MVVRIGSLCGFVRSFVRSFVREREREKRIEVLFILDSFIYKIGRIHMRCFLFDL